MMYFSAYNNGLIRNPDIVNLFSRDFYVAPLSLEEAAKADQKSIERSSFHQGDKNTMQGLQVTFLGFEIPVAQPASNRTGTPTRIGVRLMVQAPGRDPVLLIPYSVARSGERVDEPAVFDQAVIFSIGGVSLPEGKEGRPEVEIVAQTVSSGSAAGKDTLVVEASIKPLINLVWTGVILLLVGLGTTIVRRSREARTGRGDAGSGTLPSES